jgi:hypothetical protein
MGIGRGLGAFGRAVAVRPRNSWAAGGKAPVSLWGQRKVFWSGQVWGETVWLEDRKIIRPENNFARIFGYI